MCPQRRIQKHQYHLRQYQKRVHGDSHQYLEHSDGYYKSDKNFDLQRRGVNGNNHKTKFIWKEYFLTPTVGLSMFVYYMSKAQPLQKEIEDLETYIKAHEHLERCQKLSS